MKAYLYKLSGIRSNGLSLQPAKLFSLPMLALDYKDLYLQKITCGDCYFSFRLLSILKLSL